MHSASLSSNLTDLTHLSVLSSDSDHRSKSPTKSRGEIVHVPQCAAMLSLDIQ